MPWDADKAVKYLQDNAQSNSTGACAKYTRQAIEAGGVTLTRHDSAKDYGPSLVAVGFVELNYCPISNTKGDVAIIQPIPGHPHGHMEMFDGKTWISDFTQRDFWPGPGYRKQQPPYAVYRYRTVMPGQPTQDTPFDLSKPDDENACYAQ